MFEIFAFLPLQSTFFIRYSLENDKRFGYILINIKFYFRTNVIYLDLGFRVYA